MSRREILSMKNNITTAPRNEVIRRIGKRSWNAIGWARLQDEFGNVPANVTTTENFNAWLRQARKERK